LLNEIVKFTGKHVSVVFVGLSRMQSVSRYPVPYAHVHMRPHHRDKTWGDPTATTVHSAKVLRSLLLLLPFIRPLPKRNSSLKYVYLTDSERHAISAHIQLKLDESYAIPLFAISWLGLP